MSDNSSSSARFSSCRMLILSGRPDSFSPSSSETALAATNVSVLSWDFSFYPPAPARSRKAPPPETVPGVALFTAQRATVPDYIEATGTVRAAQSAQLASQVMGTITRVNVHEGDGASRRSAGHIERPSLAPPTRAPPRDCRLPNKPLPLPMPTTRWPKSTMQRYQMLYDKKSVSPQEFDEVKTKLAAAKARRDAAHAGRAQAEAAVSQAGTAVGFTSIRAPFDGLVTAKFVDAGAMAAPGVPLLIVEDPSRFRLEVQVDESQMARSNWAPRFPS